MGNGNGVAFREFRQIKLLVEQRLQEGGSVKKIYEDFLESELITMSLSSFYIHIRALLPEQNMTDMPSVGSQQQNEGG